MLISQLSQHLETADVTITLTKKGDVVTAIVVPKPKNDKISQLKPIVATGTAEELDANLAGALTTVFDKISKFKIVGVEEVVEQIESASKEEKPKKKEAVTKEKSAAAPAKENPKQIFEEAQKLFNDKKYVDALPLFKKAVELKPDSKKYQEANKLCQSWVNRLKDADMFLESNKSETIEKGVEIIKEAENFHVDPIKGNVAEVLPEEEKSFEEGMLDAEEEHFMEEAKNELADEEEDDFTV